MNVGNDFIIMHHIDGQHTSLFLCFWKLIVLCLTLLVGQLNVQRFSHRHHLKHTTSCLVGLHRSYLLLLGIEQRSLHRQVLPLLVAHRDGNPACQSAHQVTPFGIELHTVQRQVGSRFCHLSFIVHTRIRQSVTESHLVDDRIRIVALLFGFIEDREHTAEHCWRTPVGHIACEGTYLIESACTHDAVQFDVTLRLSVFNLQRTTFTHITDGIHQFHIQHRTDTRWLVRVHTFHVCLESDSLALEIARIIEMQIHLLLWCSLVKPHCTLHISQQASHLRIIITRLCRHPRGASTKQYADA